MTIMGVAEPQPCSDSCNNEPIRLTFLKHGARGRMQVNN